MSGQTGQRNVSQVANKRRSLSKKQMLAVMPLGIGALIAIVFWRVPAHKHVEPDGQRQMVTGQLISFPVYHDTPSLIASPPTAGQPPPMPTLPEPQARSISELVKTPSNNHPRMINFGTAAATSPATPGDDKQVVTAVHFTGKDIPGGDAGLLADRSLVMMPQVFHCTLDTALSSDLPGPFMCHLPADVLSPSGVVLMDKGTSIVGDYKNEMQQGQERIFAMAGTAYTPHGVVVPLDGPMADGLGRAGFDGEVDNHYLQRFGGAVLLTLVDNAFSVAQGYASRGGNSISLSSGSTQSVAGEMLGNTINIKPTLTKFQGSDVTVFVKYPIKFDKVYALKTAP